MQTVQKIVISLAVGILVNIQFFHPITALNEDLGLHLKLGGIILSTHTVPLTNLLSFTYPQFPFVNSHWLPEVIFFLVAHAVGFTGLLLFHTALILLAWTILFLTVKKSHALSIGLVSLLGIGILWNRTDIRPETFSFLFLAIFLAILYKSSAKPTKLLFILPFIELLWVNSHIYFILGPLIVLIFLADDMLPHVVSTVKRHAPLSFPTTAIFLGLTLITCCIATFFNPNGMYGAVFPFTVFHNYGYDIAENQSLFFFLSRFFFGGTNWTLIFFEISAVFLLFLLLINNAKTRLRDWMLFALFAYLGISAVRNIPLFVFATFTFFVVYLDRLLTWCRSVWEKRAGKTIPFTGVLFILFIGIAYFEIGIIIARNPIGSSLIPNGKNAADFFLANRLHGPIFNNFDIGSYLSYRLYPLERVFVDGRPEAYPASFFQDTYIPMQEDPKKFAQEDVVYHFNTIMFAHTEQTDWARSFLTAITANSQWKLVYLDSAVAVYVKNAPQNQEIIKRFTITPDSFDIQKALVGKDEKSAIFLALFFAHIGWADQATKTLQLDLAKYPSSCTALYFLSTLKGVSQQLQDIYNYQYALHCS